MRWVNSQLGRVLGWVERAIQQEVIAQVYFILLPNHGISGVYLPATCLELNEHNVAWYSIFFLQNLSPTIFLCIDSAVVYICRCFLLGHSALFR